ncbi:MAG: TIGR04086 family membrane protein [Firmicutes bacterium]|nr:TIGR04086 family membrane protein [Bacillota bacterium]
MNRMAKGILWGTGLSLALLFSLSLAAAACVYYTPLDQQTLSVAAVIIDAAALFAGGLAAGKKAGAKGMLLGLAVGGLILALMAVCGGIHGQWLGKTLLCLLAAAAGGIAGVR